METKWVLLGFAMFSFPVICDANLRCYECDSRKDPMCGVQWKVDEPELYIVNCNKNQTSCRKIVSDMFAREKPIVRRGCYDGGWKNNKTEKYVPNECREEQHDHEACYCTGDLCNGQSRTVAQTLFLLLLAIIVLTQ